MAQGIRESKEEIAKLYKRVYEGPPWYEQYKVILNEKEWAFGGPEDLIVIERLRSKGILEEDDIQPFYTKESTIETVERSSGTNGFVAVAATTQNNSGKIVGVS